MQNLSVFKFEESKEVRTLTDERDGSAWFVLKDVLQAMGRKGARTNEAKSSIKAGLGDGCSKVHPLLTAGGIQETTIINEAALVFLSMRSNSAKSKAAVSSIVAQISDSKAIIRALQDFEVPDDLPDMYVYAIRESESGRVKVGISRNPETRLKQLQTGNSQHLELVAYRKAENRYQDEAATHQLLGDCHVRGEWFSPDALELLTNDNHNNSLMGA